MSAPFSSLSCTGITHQQQQRRPDATGVLVLHPPTHPDRQQAQWQTSCGTSQVRHTSMEHMKNSWGALLLSCSFIETWNSDEVSTSPKVNQLETRDVAKDGSDDWGCRGRGTTYLIVPDQMLTCLMKAIRSHYRFSFHLVVTGSLQTPATAGSGRKRWASFFFFFLLSLFFRMINSRYIGHMRRRSLHASRDV